jgi:hypothetical protein
MKIENDNVFYLDFDDVPPHEKRSITKSEIDNKTESDWNDTKNHLQDILWRSENADNNPAFNDQAIYAWIEQYAEKFDRFFQIKRTTEPEQLLSWLEQSSSSDNADESEFIREWVAFKDHADTSEKESVAA